MGSSVAAEFTGAGAARPVDLGGAGAFAIVATAAVLRGLGAVLATGAVAALPPRAGAFRAAVLGAGFLAARTFFAGAFLGAVFLAAPFLAAPFLTALVRDIAQAP